MSLLTLCQNVARQVGLAVPATVAGNDDETVAAILAFAQREGRTLSRLHDWVVLQKEHVFTTVAGTATYALPSDFRSLVTRTAWNRSGGRRLGGPTTPIHWQARRSSGTTRDVNDLRYRIVPESLMSKFTLDPVPTSAETLAFEYVSTVWCKSAGGVGQTAWAADSDEALIEENLIELGVIARVLNRLGLPYAEERAEYEAELLRARARDGGMAIAALDRGRSRSTHGNDLSGNPPSWGNTPGLVWGYTD